MINYKKILRVFPRKTKATPDDENVRIRVFPSLFDEADEIHVSVTFDSDKSFAEKLAKQWEKVAFVKIGGVAYNDPGSEFEPGMYLKKGYVITSRGCPNHCWFCKAWRNEGNIRELKIKNGFNVQGNNLLACSQSHQEKVFEMLLQQKERPRFTGGFDAALFTEWHLDRLVKLKPEIVFFAYDTPDDKEPLIEVIKIFQKANIPNLSHSHRLRCFVLIGYQDDTIESANERLNFTMSLGFMPMAMLYKNDIKREDILKWKRFQRTWANPTIIGYRMKLLK